MYYSLFQIPWGSAFLKNEQDLNKAECENGARQPKHAFSGDSQKLIQRVDGAR